MENLLTFLIILIFIFRGLSKLIESARRGEEKKEEPHPQEWKQYFESMGIPPVEAEKETVQQPSPAQQTKKVAVEPAPLPLYPNTLIPSRAQAGTGGHRRAQVKTKIKKREVQEELPSPIPPQFQDLSLDKVREGIILSEILGLPRAKK